MKLQIASNLHLEMHRNHQPPIQDFFPAGERDVLVLAREIDVYQDALEFVESEARVSPVIYVPGNHEYYRGWGRKATAQFWREVAEETPDLHYVDGDSVTIEGVRFWGAAWYSDLRGRRDPGQLHMVENSVMDFASGINDAGTWTVQRHIAEHERQTGLLRAEADRVDVAITHWPPIREATASRFRGSPLSGYFVNDRENVVREIGAQQLWISGHARDPYDCMVGRTRCIGNPCGYPGELPETEGFRADRIVEVEPQSE